MSATESPDARSAVTLDLSLLQKSLPASEKPGLDTLDPRFQNIATLVEGSDFIGAAAEVENLIREDIYDIRTLGYYLYAVFFQNGVAGLGDIFGVWAQLFGENWGALGPAKKKEQHAQNALSWFYTRLQKRLEFEQEQKTAEFERWKETVDHEAAQAIIDRHAEMRKALAQVIPEPKAGEMIKKVDDWLKAFQKLVYVEPPPPEPEPAAEAPAATPEEPAPAARPGQPAAAATAGVAAATDRPIAEGSHHLQVLIDKLRAFETLIEKQDFQKAAVVANDVAGIVGAFDPRVYFPKLFSRYYALLSRNVEQIEPLWANKETTGWQMLEQFYRVDLGGFVEG
jgi:hypothetical protein